VSILIKHEYQIAMASDFSEQVFQVGEVDILELTRPHFQRNSAAIAQPAGTFANRPATSTHLPRGGHGQPATNRDASQPSILLSCSDSPTALTLPASNAQPIGLGHHHRVLPPSAAVATATEAIRWRLQHPPFSTPLLHPLARPYLPASVPSPSRLSCPPLRASSGRPLGSRFVASAAPTMKPPTESRISTVVDVDLGDRSYPIYIGSGLLDEPDLLQR
jgi:hypothetical protein